jgi:hypothetical protein
LVKNATTEENAKRMREFVNWLKNEWEQEGDNIYLWDFYELETEGGLYLKDEYTENPNNSHPNKQFAERVAPVFAEKIVELLAKGD